MSEKNSVVPNICPSGQPTSGPADVIWTADFSNENCLPVIGSCQVSSILSTLENVQANKFVLEQQNRNMPQERSTNSFKSIPINIINSDSVPSVDDVKKRKKNKKENAVLEKSQLFQEMLYFGCNLCPFICTKDSKISDHIISVHKNKEDDNRPPLKCPGCPNIFYHKLSLRSHLIHDHEVNRSDINKIVNSIVYVSVLSENNKKQSALTENNKKNTVDFLGEDVRLVEHIDNNSEEDNMGPSHFLQAVSNELQKTAPEIEPLPDNYSPKLEIMNENILNTDTKQPSIITRRSSATKIEEYKKNQKCCISTCAVRMRDVQNMAYHIKCHFEKVFRCLECNGNFVIWKTLQTHLWRSHNIDMELYSCDKCNYKTYSLAKLNNVHKLIHGDEKPFLCDLCGKGFKNPKQLRNHKIVHKVKSSDLLQQCPVCNRTFSDKRQLKVHIAGVHQKIKPFSCNFCGYKAASNGTLKLHIRQHTGEKPFMCDSCDYTTADHNSLRRHKSRHSGQKKYKCAHCDYACIQSSTYKTHLKTKHPGLENEHMFSCHLCQFRSISNDKYMIHMASHKEKKKQNQKIIDIIENMCEETEGLEERVVEIVSLNNKKSNEVEFVNLTSIKPQSFVDFSIPTEENYSSQKLYKTPKKQIRIEPNIENTENVLQETPVALISKVNDINTDNHCIILPVQTENLLNLTNVSQTTVLPTTTISTSNIQYFYNGSNVLLEVIEEKSK